MDFNFTVVGQIKFIIFQFKRCELESCICGFIMHCGCLAEEGYFIALAKLLLEKISCAIAVNRIWKFRMNKNT